MARSESLAEKPVFSRLLFGDHRDQEASTAARPMSFSSPSGSGACKASTTAEVAVSDEPSATAGNGYGNKAGLSREGGFRVISVFAVN